MTSTLKSLNFTKFDSKNKMIRNLGNVFGIGFFSKKELLFRLGYSHFDALKIREIDSFFLSRLYKFSKLFIKSYSFRFKRLQKFLRLEIKIKTKKSFYLKHGYPVNNQRRRTNGKTAQRLNKYLFNLLSKKK